MIYCPYADRDIPEKQSNFEHIIPLSLGGTNELMIDVDKSLNSRLGSELDGALANEFLVALRRSEFDARGHNRREPWAVSKKASYGDRARPAQVHLHRKHGLRLWDARANKLIKGSEPVQFNVLLNVYLPIRFAAKVALAAGYFAYGDRFRHHVDHHKLREVMQMDLANIDQEDVEGRLDENRFTALADDYLSENPSPKDWKLRCIRKFCDGVRGSVVVLIPSEERLLVFVGILGKYLALINVPADTKSFPNEEDYEWGHVLAVIDRKLVRCSWAEGLRQLAVALKRD